VRKKKRIDALPPTAALNTHQEQGRRYITPPEIIAELGQSIDIHTLLAQQIRKIRERRGLRQDDLARLSWDFGLDWQQDTVASIESGRRKISLEEFLLLPAILEAKKEELFPGDCEILLTPKITIDERYWTEFFYGYPILSSQQKQAHAEEAKAAAQPLELERHISFTDEAMESYSGSPVYVVPDSSHLRLDDGGRGAGRGDAPLRDAEIKAARKLGVEGHVIVETAQKLWNRSLPDERDARLRSNSIYNTLTTPEGRPIVAKHSLQALRGHITRQLLVELRKEIKPNVTKPKTRRKK